MHDELLTLGEVAAFLRVGRSTIQAWCRSGEFPAARIGKEYRIRRSDLEQWYERRMRRAS